MPDRFQGVAARAHIRPQGQCFRFFGMRRSGNHAMINWVQRNLPDGEMVFFNNCQTGSPLESFQAVEFAGQTHEWRNILKPQNCEVLDRLCTAWPEAPHHLLSYEDKTPSEVFAAGQGTIRGYAPQVAWCDVIIYRRFLNWLASFVKLVERKRSNPLRHALRNGLPNYRRLLSVVDGAAHESTGPVAILYDTWGTDAPYRQAVLESLGLTERDNALGALSRYGGGSSFASAEQQASDAARAERWTGMEENETFRALLQTVLEDEAYCALITRHFPQDTAIARDILKS